jgi:3-deoxy-D-manno-octulosonic-acid transferase
MKPDLVIWIKYDYWYHYLHQLHLQHIPVVLVSAMFRADQPFFKWYGGVHRRMLGFFSQIFVQDKTSEALLLSISVASTVAPDTRFDRVHDIMTQRTDFENVARFKGTHTTVIAGSTWDKDIDILCQLINSRAMGEGFRFIIAPHDVDKERIKHITDSLTVPKVLFSRLVERNATDYEVLIIDSTGILAQLYAYGDIAYIGGGFDAGIHNILEPIVYGMPVIFGPKHLRSGEAKYLLSQPTWQVAHTISDYPTLLQALEGLLADDAQNLAHAKIKSKAYIHSYLGGTQAVYTQLVERGWLK